MKIFVDADACPVKEIIVSSAKKVNIPVFMFIDTSHSYSDGYSAVITVDKGADSADFAIINRIESGDICVTQDYGLASMVLAKNAYAVHQNGFEYTSENIERMLFERHIGSQMRRIGKHGGKTKKRTKENDENFESFFISLLQKLLHA